MNELNHLAIIMDGNGRWAKLKGFIRSKGHEKGAFIIDDIVSVCIDERVKNLTLFAFSTENWKRPKSEIEYLLSLAKKFLRDKESLFVENGVKFTTKGDLRKLDDELNFLISNLKEKTKDNKNLTLAIAVNYGSKDEIVRACKALKEQNLEINEENLSKNLDSPEMGEVNLFIRTGGEQRLSNFLLWQCAYAELFFTPTLWPDFSKKELKEMIGRYRKIHRKFGGL